jgi:hypothetical protein
MVFPVGGGPVISPAAAGAAINAVDRTAAITQLGFIDELPSTSSQWNSRESVARGKVNAHTIES